MEGLLARSTLQSGGGSLKARGSSRLILVDDGFFVAQAISLSNALDAPSTGRSVKMKNHRAPAYRDVGSTQSYKVLYIVEAYTYA